MAATIPEYVDPLLRHQESWASQLGSSITRGSQEPYNINLTLLAFISVIMQALHDKGVVLDAEWLARLDAVLQPQQNWTTADHAWILRQLPPPT